MAPIAIGVVGIGFGQAVIVPAFRRDPRATVAAICASTTERAESVAKRCGIARAFGDWRALADSVEIEAIAIAVPPALQPEIALAAMRAGKHVFCEKPLALTLAASRRLAVAAEASGVANTVDFEFAELPAWRCVKDLVRSGDIGAVREVSWIWRVETRPRPPDSWKADPAAGAGAIGGFAVHALYLAEWILGPAVAVEAARITSGSQLDTWLALQSGASLSLSVATDAYLGTGHRVELYGDTGTIVVENSGLDHARGFAVTLGRRSDRTAARVPLEPDDSDGDGRIAPVASLANRFLDAIVYGTTVRPAIADGVRVAALMQAIEDAARTGQCQKL